MPKSKKKETPADKAFAELIKLYDVADNLENDGESDEADNVRQILNKVGKFILKGK